MKKAMWVLIAIIALLAIGIGAKLYFWPACQNCEDGNNCTINFCKKGACQVEYIDNCDGNDKCEIGEFKISKDCPSCDDNNSCTQDLYNYQNLKCYNYRMTPCDGNGICEPGEVGKIDCEFCNDNDSCTNDDYDFNKNICINKIIFPCCGNGVCEANESFLKCQSDCLASKNDILAFCKTDDTCKKKYALKYNNMEFCYLATSKQNANDCITSVAIQTNDTTICENSFMSTDYNTEFGKWYDQEGSKQMDIDKCEQEVIVNIRDPLSCLSKLTYPNRCIEQIAVVLKNNTICNLSIKEPGFAVARRETVDKCTYIVNLDYTKCKFISVSWVADDCILQIAKSINNAEICKEHSTPGACEKEVLEI